MKIIFAIVITTFLLSACARDKPTFDPATELLNDSLKQLYRDITNDVSEDKIVGQSLDLSLRLRFCSETDILFDDTKIIVDKKTKYYFVKWEFEPTVVNPIIGKKNVRCRIKGKITEVRRGETTPGMPYLIVKLDRIILQQ